MGPFDEMTGQVTDAAALLKALAHPERLMVLCQLVEAEKGVGELPAHSQLGQSAFSQQIDYSLVSEAAADVLAALQTHFCHSENKES